MKTLFIITYTLWFTINMEAQNVSTTNQALRIGDHVPHLSFGPVDNYPTPTVSIDNFKGKLTIFDFWGTYCVGCIMAFPKLDSLQKQFGDAIQIILVNHQPTDKIEQFRIIRKESASAFKMPNLVSVTNDKILHGWFPHSIIPHEVWVDGNGKVRAVTGSEYITFENIRSMLRDSTFRLPEKKDFLTHDWEKALLPQAYPIYPDMLQYYSSIIHYIPGLIGTTSRYFVDSIHKNVRVTRNPAPLLTHYGGGLTRMKGFDYPYDHAYFDFGRRVVLEVKDSTRFIRPLQPDIAWEEKNCYGYETIAPLELIDSLDAYMVADLNRFFRLNGRIEKRLKDCLSIVRLSNRDKIKSTQSRQTVMEIRADKPYRLLHGNMELFRNHLSKANPNCEFIINDDTGYSGWIDLEFSVPLNNLSLIKEELKKKYDLDIIKTRQLVDVMVISDRN